ncbi:carbon-nitrogen hydrolase family protein [Kocuria sp. SM24M-10]|uniref:carbon-nitrogen hydrolase family protein n=1 Tax=Kocuria sp. SM24M-10 TaxID=1660349 RepID=UPI00064AD2BD|nr:carbon-nitrogen hydrolase family protein [Kocuria sp. SM24M-10]KLU09160.1 nitrilase [Kocuria sp. SM24M-10]
MKIAVLQAEATVLDLEANLRVVDDAARRARQDGADLLLTPELFPCGYSPELVRQRLTAEDLRLIADRAAAIARRHGIALVYSAPREGTGGRWHIAATLLDDAGRAVLSYDKVHLFGEEERRAFTPAEDAPQVVEHGGLRVSLLICYDVEFPESVRAASDQGAELLLVPTALGAGFAAVPNILLPARALESQVVIAYANHCGTESGLEFGGESVVAGADGSLLAHAGTGPDLVHAVVDSALVAAARERVPYLRDRRPDLYGRWGGRSAR